MIEYAQRNNNQEHNQSYQQGFSNKEWSSMDLNKNVFLEVLLNNKTCVPFISIRNPKIQLI